MKGPGETVAIANYFSEQNALIKLQTHIYCAVTINIYTLYPKGMLLSMKRQICELKYLVGGASAFSITPFDVPLRTRGERN